MLNALLYTFILYHILFLLICDAFMCVHCIAFYSLATEALINNNNNNIRFQIDNGSSVNIVPLHIYKKASGDMNLERLKPSNTQSITVYGNGAWSVLGEVIVRVWRKRHICLVRLLIVEGEQFHCILGRNACIELGCVEILDNDALHKPDTHCGNVFATQQVVTETHLPHSDSPLSTEQLKQSYKSVFSGEVGKLDGQNEQIDPVREACSETNRSGFERTCQRDSEWYVWQRHNRACDKTDRVDLVNGGCYKEVRTIKVNDRVCLARVFITYNKWYMYIASIVCKTTVTSVLYH